MITEVHLATDAYFSCMNHALSTDKEEIVGTLLGRIVNNVSYLDAAVMLERTVKLKDRVEVSPEQLSLTAEIAEKLSQETGKELRVLGWYHSHPHFTHYPSHIDIRTQAEYQLMDKNFIGLIFSVFNCPAGTKTQQFALGAFQAETPEKSRDITVHVVPNPMPLQHNFRNLIKLPKLLMKEEQETYDKAQKQCKGESISSLHNEAACNIMKTLSVPVTTLLKRLAKNLSAPLAPAEQNLDSGATN